MKKSCCWVNYKWDYPEPDSHIRDKVIVVLDLSNYATKKELDHATGVDTSDLTAKKDFIALKAEVDKLNMKACVRYFLSNFYFFNQIIAL